ncbi:MAG: hypothetical protein ACOYKM_12195 [Caulobacterales bacterium]
MTTPQGSPPPTGPNAPTPTKPNSRVIGAGVGAAAILGALVLALGHPPKEAPPTAPQEQVMSPAPSAAQIAEPTTEANPPSPLPATAPAQAPTTASRPVAEPATTTLAPQRGYCPQSAAPFTILVAFSEGHSMHRAQSQFAAGNRDQALRTAIRQVSREPALRGLCVVRFTIGGAEVVMAPVDGAQAAQGERDRLVAVLNEAEGITYAYPSIAVQAQAVH